MPEGLGLLRAGYVAPMTFRPPVSAHEVIAASVQSFLSAAALHLGESTADGQTLAQRDPQEAWKALVAANALIKQLEPMMHESFKASLTYLVERLAVLHPNVDFPVPEALVGGRS